MWAHSACDDLMTQVRSRSTADGLVALGTFVTGRPCYLAHGGIALRGTGDTRTPVSDCAGNGVQTLVAAPADPSLAALDVEAMQAGGQPSAPLDRRALIGGLLWRAGLLLRMLDTAFAHLSGRQSGGQKTLQHQLVKAAFTECFALAEQVRLEAPHWLQGLSSPEAAALHARLDVATTRAAKLMGAHGYLRGSLNSLECLSFCVAALLSDVTAGQARAAA